MLRVSILKIVGRVVSAVLLLVLMMGPWFADGHPATEATCSPPFVWLGDGYCACLWSFVASVESAITNENAVWLVLQPPALPVLSTLLLLLFGERRWLWVCHLAAWGLLAIFSLLWFFGLLFIHRGVLILWGAGLGGAVAVAILVVEILLARLQFSMDHREVIG